MEAGLEGLEVSGAEVVGLVVVVEVALLDREQPVDLAAAAAAALVLAGRVGAAALAAQAEGQAGQAA